LDARERVTKAENLAKQYEQELAATRRKSQATIEAAQADAKKIGLKDESSSAEAQAQREQAQQEMTSKKQRRCIA
jgi:F-type H+-transporting ATPase subunit b